jgi:hypothetical protein
LGGFLGLRCFTYLGVETLQCIFIFFPFSSLARTILPAYMIGMIVFGFGVLVICQNAVFVDLLELFLDAKVKLVGSRMVL